uniref:Uncharacterized protein n=1 Tax=Oryza sativa subsp. japonica TaxID=39947 RepID=Q6YVE9_ORYSJ|nr:hypothetical protein [Oryza sativa Japonica Group]BAD17656.1 hypothetical protein [Oryza sativa Japonica Group]
MATSSPVVEAMAKVIFSSNGVTVVRRWAGGATVEAMGLKETMDMVDGGGEGGMGFEEGFDSQQWAAVNGEEGKREGEQGGEREVASDASTDNEISVVTS